MKKYILLLSAALIAITTYAQAKLGFRGEEAASVGIYIKNLKTGQIVSQNDPYRALLPASTMKSVTAAAALYDLGPDFKFKTPVYLSGSKSSTQQGLWNGNLIIESCGDPTIDSELFKDKTPMWQEIVTGLKDLGVNTIAGEIIILESLTDDGCIPEWEIDDVAWGYGAGLYGFNFADNKFTLWPLSGDTDPYIPTLDITLIPSSDNDLIRGVNSSSLTVKGPNITSPNYKVTSTMDNPAEAYIANLEDKLAGQGITVMNGDIDDLTNQKTVCIHYSTPLSEMLQQTMYESHNLFAEGMLRALSPAGTRKNALDKEKNLLTKIGANTSYNKICDGSGLARADRLQPVFLSEVFEGMAKSQYADEYVSLFPKAGVDGTVKSLLEKTSLKGKLALKSGSMGGVQCFAGYKIDNEGKPTHTVVILVNGFFCSRGELRGAIEKFLLDTFKQ